MNTPATKSSKPKDAAERSLNLRPVWAVTSAMVLFGFTVFGLFSAYHYKWVAVSQLTFTDVADAQAAAAAIVSTDIEAVYTNPAALPWALRSVHREITFEPIRAFRQFFVGTRSADWYHVTHRTTVFVQFPEMGDPDYRTGTWTLPVHHPYGRIDIAFNVATGQIRSSVFTPLPTPEPSASSADAPR